MTRYHGMKGLNESIVLALLLAGVGMLAVLHVDDIVPPLGHHPGLGYQFHLPSDDVATDYRLGFLWSVALGLTLLVWPVRHRDRTALLRIWLVKMVVALGAMVVVESQYEGLDGFYYFGQPQRVGFLMPNFVFGDGTSNMLSLSWLHQQVLPVSYHAMKVSFAMAGLLGIYVFYRAAVRFLGREDVRVLYLLGLFPSIVYFSSILGKDPVMLLGISLYIYGVVGIHHHRSVDVKWLAYATSVAAGVALASLVRIWLGPILLAPLAVFVLLALRNVLAQALVVVVVATALGQTITLLNATFEVETKEDLIEKADEVSHGWAKGSGAAGGSSQSVKRFDDLRSMVAFAPVGAFTALFRPLPGEVLSPLGILAGFENLALLGLLVRAIKRTRLKELKHPLILWAIILLLIWSVVFGFVSTQNLGTGARWKLQVLPLLVGLLFYLGRRRAEPLYRPAPRNTELRSVPAPGHVGANVR